VFGHKDHFHRKDAKKYLNENKSRPCVPGVCAMSLLLTGMLRVLPKLTTPGTMPELMHRNP
jgi:hypothetical protein